MPVLILVSYLGSNNNYGSGSNTNINAETEENLRKMREEEEKIQHDLRTKAVRYALINIEWGVLGQASEEVGRPGLTR